MRDVFLIKIETWHKPDMGALENVPQLVEETLKDVEVVSIGIANKDNNYKPEQDHALFQSTKTGRGPLSAEWKDELRSECPHIWSQSNSTGGVRRPKWRTSSTSKGGFEHGGHQADGRRDPKGARGAA